MTTRSRSIHFHACLVQMPCTRQIRERGEKYQRKKICGFLFTYQRHECRLSSVRHAVKSNWRTLNVMVLRRNAIIFWFFIEKKRRKRFVYIQPNLELVGIIIIRTRFVFVSWSMDFIFSLSAISLSTSVFPFQEFLERPPKIFALMFASTLSWILIHNSKHLSCHMEP